MISKVISELVANSSFVHQVLVLHLCLVDIFPEVRDLVGSGLLLLPQQFLEIILVVDSRANRLWRPSYGFREDLLPLIR